MTYRTRFAPSPTGPLHLGHAFSAWSGYVRAQAASGEFLVRIEDLDESRARPEWENQLLADLDWLGVIYPHPVLRQSDQHPAYQNALERLWADGILFSCTCTRRDIAHAASAPQEGVPVTGPDGLVYPGTCRGRNDGIMPRDTVLRLDMARALERAGVPAWTETGLGPRGETGQVSLDDHHMRHCIGDVAVRRPGMAAAYHLAVVVDDAHQNITEVVRGADLFEATAIHVLLQRLLGYPVPDYHHHALVRDDRGKRLAKRDDARAIAAYRDAGLSPAEVLVQASRATFPAS